MSFRGAHALGPCESQSRSLHIRGTTVVELEEAGWAWGRASVLHTLQGVVWVAALPFHQGLTQASGIRISLTAPVFTDVICGVSVGDGERVEGHGREGERSTFSEKHPGVNRSQLWSGLTWSFLAFLTVTSLDQCSFAQVPFLAGFPLVLGPLAPVGAENGPEVGAFLPCFLLIPPLASFLAVALLLLLGAQGSGLNIDLKCHMQAGRGGLFL